MVEDRRFRVSIEIDSWEETNPIFLGENLDHHLGLDKAEVQEAFIRQQSPPSSIGSDHGRYSSFGSDRGRSLVLNDTNFPSLQQPLPLLRPHGLLF